jgi:23S rRNA pseudouridine1911/1915/1917 synthase|tara:strand:+ start:1049 stop:1738 length:690 start_codon:yes stop_codon:yes gene_type:complete
LKELSNIDNLIVLYEDNHIIAVNKRVGDIVQGDKTGDNPLSEIVKSFLKKKYNKLNNVFLGVVHRIDRPTSGVVIFAKTSKSLKRLNNMIKNSEIEKFYWAITKNKPEKRNDTLVHWLKKNPKNNKSTHFKKETENSKKAILHYKIIKELKNYYLLEVLLETGRHHQIRTQLSAVGCPIKGDLKYGYERSNKDGGICLHAKKISFSHPVTKKKILISAPLFEHDIWKEL